MMFPFCSNAVVAARAAAVSAPLPVPATVSVLSLTPHTSVRAASR
jgi:hypothetical protein